MKSFKTLYRKSLTQVELPQIEAFIQLIIKDAKKFDGIDIKLLERQLNRIKNNEDNTKECYLFIYTLYEYHFQHREDRLNYYNNLI